MSELIHPSSLGDWAGCPKRAYHALDHAGGRDVPSIATWVGEAAHAAAANLPSVPDPSGWTLFDSITPDVRTGRNQASSIATIYRQTLESRGLSPVSVELDIETPFVHGTLDALLAQDMGHRLVINDLKTGQTIPHGTWLQLGSYFEGYNHNCPSSPATHVMVIHVPRTPVGKPQSVRVLRRWGPPCAAAARVLVDEVTRWLETCNFDTVPATPGTICYGCPLEACAVRISKKED